MDRNWTVTVAEWVNKRRANRERAVVPVDHPHVNVGFLVDELSHRLANGTLTRDTPILAGSMGPFEGFYLDPESSSPSAVVLVSGI